MKEMLKEIIGTRAYANVCEYADVLHKGDVDAWIADVVLSVVGPIEFEQHIEKLRAAHG